MSLNTLFYSRKTSKSPYPWVLLAFPLSFSPCLPAWSNRGDKENLPQASDVVCLSPGTVHCLQSLLIDRDRVTGRWGLFDVINANKAAWLLCLQRIEPPNPKPAALKHRHAPVPAFVHIVLSTAGGELCRVGRT